MIYGVLLGIGFVTIPYNDASYQKSWDNVKELTLERYDLHLTFDQVKEKSKLNDINPYNKYDVNKDGFIRL